jgi:dienelactone hydrolase
VTLAAATLLLAAVPASAFDAALEAKNFAKTSERMQYVTLTPEFQQRLIEANADNLAAAAEIAATDPERNFAGNVCANGGQECAGDVRFYDWEKAGMGMVEPVLFTARNGSTISGRLWASVEGPSKRPLVVITNGSVQAPERLYWGQAATLAKHGYVVLTYDPQGQGLSDTFGAGADRFDGVPSQEGRPFFDNTEDALDFALSTPDEPYDPRPSCTSGTDHSAKQDRRVEAGLNAGFNPLFELVDRRRIGIVGHSLGAAAVSYIGQIDPRVDAIVAWDNLGAPSGGRFGVPECESGSSPRPAEPAIETPAMGITNDYGIAPAPMTEDPDPQRGNEGFLAYKDAGVDSFELHIRGGTHEESAFIPGMTVPILGLASLRGGDLVAWYTSAWMDRYVRCGSGRCEREADSRLLSDRWLDDERSGQIDANGDPNVYSFYTRSRYDFHEAGGREAVCDDMRAGCPSMRPDGLPPGYDFVADAYTLPSGNSGEGAPCALPQRGSPGRDTPSTLPASGAGDAIRGRGGDDRLWGGAGDDCVYGAGGSDRIAGNPGADELQGGGAGDRLGGGAGSDRLRGGRGADRIRGAGGSDRIASGPGADRIDARGGGADTIDCGSGRDRVRADGRDRLGENC